MIIVTGGAGFIGSVLISELNKRGREDILVVDRLYNSEKWKNLRNLKFDDYIHADEFFMSGILEELENVEAVFHMGACSSTTEMDMDYLMENNVNFSRAIWQYCASEGIPLLYASSAATYGEGELGYSDDQDLALKLKPLNPYGYSKFLFDRWALGQEITPPRWYGFKFFNVFGPNEYHKAEMRSLVHKAFGQINETGKVKLFKSHREGFADGEQKRDFVYVKDVVAAMLEFWDKASEQHSGIFNLGCGKAHTFKQFMEATFEGMGKPVDIEFIPMPESIRDQYQYFTEADMEKFFGVFPGFKFTSLQDAVGDYVRNHLMQVDPHCQG